MARWVFLCLSKSLNLHAVRNGSGSALLRASEICSGGSTMVQAVFCTKSTKDQIEAALSQMKSEGIQPAALTLVSRPQELDWVVCPQSKLNLSVKRGVIGGAGIGVVVGILMLLYTGSLHTFWGELSLVGWESFGCALFGM